MDIPTRIWKWLPVAALLTVGFWLYFFTAGHGFLGIICWGIAGVIGCYYLLSMLQKRQKVTAKVLRRMFTCLLIVGLWVYGLSLIPILYASAAAPAVECQYIIVLGAKVNGTAPSRILKDRIAAAYDYLVNHPEAVAVLSGGQGTDEGISEAQCMFNELTKMGISPHRLWLEEQATSTRENLRFSLEVIAERTGRDPGRVGILSNEFHLFRAGLVAKECEVDAILIPAKTSWFTLRLNYSLREVAAVWFYILSGG